MVSINSSSLQGLLMNPQWSNSPIGNTSLQTQQRNSLINPRTVPRPSAKSSQMPFLVFQPLGICLPNQQQCQIAWWNGIQAYLWISASGVLRRRMMGPAMKKNWPCKGPREGTRVTDQLLHLDFLAIIPYHQWWIYWKVWLHSHLCTKHIWILTLDYTTSPKRKGNFQTPWSSSTSRVYRQVMLRS